MTSRAIYKLISAGLVETTTVKETDVLDPREEDSLFWLLLRVYASAFSQIQKILETKIGSRKTKNCN